MRIILCIFLFNIFFSSLSMGSVYPDSIQESKIKKWQWGAELGGYFLPGISGTDHVYNNYISAYKFSKRYNSLNNLGINSFLKLNISERYALVSEIGLFRTSHEFYYSTLITYPNNYSYEGHSKITYNYFNFLPLYFETILNPKKGKYKINITIGARRDWLFFEDINSHTRSYPFRNYFNYSSRWYNNYYGVLKTGVRSKKILINLVCLYSLRGNLPQLSGKYGMPYYGINIGLITH